MGRQLKFGVQTGLDRVEWGELLEFWRFLDGETAYDNLWTFDHFVPPMPGADPNESCLEGWTALAAAAVATERLRVGCLVTGNTYRHPAVLAKMAATVDQISNGRLIFGLGAAWHEAEHRAYGIPFYTQRERQDRLEEAAELIRALFRSEGPLDFQGRYYPLRQAPFVPRCVQRPHPPIMIGGGGERRTLRTLARFGDMMNVSGPVSDVRHKIDVLQRHCEDVGRDPAEIEATVFAPILVTEDAALNERFCGAVAAAMNLSVEKVRTEMPVGAAEHVNRVLERYAEIGVSMVISPAQAPYPTQVYRRISEEVVAEFQ
jgi:F420-dependent oxidoreductase-like protein